MNDNFYVENELSRSYTDEFLDRENGEDRGSSTDRTHALHHSSLTHQISDKRPSSSKEV